MSRQDEIRTCLSCKFSACRGSNNCPALKVDSKKKVVEISVLRDLLLAGYDPAEVCFAVVDGTALT